MTSAADLLKRIQDRTSNVGVIGLGYVGLPLAVTALKRGFPVTGFDIDATKIDRLHAGESYIDAVSQADLSDATTGGKARFTADFTKIAECDVIVICVPTPLTAQRDPDLRFVVETAEEIVLHIRPETLVVLESTTFPGTTEDVLAPILEKSGLALGKDLFVAFSPEREDPGNKSFQTQTIPKVVGGLGQDAKALAAAFYAGVVDTVIEVSSASTAEAVKITENVFRAVNIAMVNELKIVFEEMDIDVWEVIDAAATKPFGYMPFYPGPGLGGHCIPIDPFYLAWKSREYGVPTRFIELAGEINTKMPARVVERLRKVVDQSCGKGLSASRVLLVGMSYKKNVPDMRESPSMRLLQLMAEAGCDVQFLDPLVSEIPPMREYAEYAGRIAVEPGDLGDGGFDAILISTDHDAIDYGALVSLGIPIIDTRNAIARRGLSMDNVVKA